MPPPLDTSYRGTSHTLHPSCALPPPPCSPLKGNGLPQLETDKVYVSAYLDRLLGVNEDDYRFEVIAGNCQLNAVTQPMRSSLPSQ